MQDQKKNFFWGGAGRGVWKGAVTEEKKCFDIVKELNNSSLWEKSLWKEEKTNLELLTPTTGGV